jgi:hypothetical protein
MKTIGLIFAVALMSGCQTGSSAPAQGMANLRVAVSAQAKIGANMANAHVSVFDEPGNRPADAPNAMQKVDYNSLADIVVWLEPIENVQPPKLPLISEFHQVIDVNPQIPATDLAACASIGYSIQLRNHGEKPANFYSVSDGNEFDAGVIQPGESAGFTPKSAGLIEVFTDSLAQPVARIYVAPTPWARLTQSGQTVEFHNLPPGKWKIVSWHPRLPGHDTVVDLMPDQTSNSAVDVSVNGLPQVSAR